MLKSLREQPARGANPYLVNRGSDLPARMPVRRFVRYHLRRSTQRVRPCAPAWVGGSPAPATRNEGVLHLHILAVVEAAHNHNAAPPWIHLH
eukprot:1966394-Pyramimonas_sp.AAC.1